MFIDPARMLEACSVRANDTIAEFGAGSGFIVRAAQVSVPQGQVFAIDINRDIVTRLIREMRDDHIENVHPLWGDIEVMGGSQLADESCNMVVLSNILFQLEDRNGALREAYRVLVPGGTLLVVDWTESFKGMGPAPHHVFTKDRAIDLVTRERFAVTQELIPVGDHHYGILCKKQ